MMAPTEAAAYETLMGRWSRRVAREFVAWLDVAPRGRWLDVGCGTGAVTNAILAMAEPREVWGVDPEADYIAHLHAALPGQQSRFLLGDAQALPPELRDFDATVSGLVLNLVAEPAAALAEMIRVTRVGGMVAAYVWDFSGVMQLVRHFWDVAAELDPAARLRDPGVCFPLCRLDRLQELFRRGGLASIHTRSLELAMAFKSFDDYWSPFLGDRGRAGSYLATLSAAQRLALEERLAAAVPRRRDGSIVLEARAWAIRGITERAM